MWSVTFDRTGLGLEPLVITGNPSTGDFHLAEEDCTWPAFTMRRTYAGTSNSIGGAQLLHAVPDQGTIQLKILAHAATTAALEDARAELAAATTQFAYVLTLVVDGVTVGAYNADPEFPQWGQLDSGKVRAKLNEATITIPINPPGSA